MSRDYQVAIPSYKRSQTIQVKTLAALAHQGVSPEIVTIFVANNDELTEYQEALKDNPYGKRIVVAVPTIQGARNFIERYYPEGTHLVMCDDDIEKFLEYDEATDSLVPLTGWAQKFVQAGFELCHKHGARTFGLYPAPNAYFMGPRPEYDTRLVYIIASCFGIIIEHDDSLKRNVNHGEDYEYSILQYIKHGAVVRLNKFTLQSKYWGEEGGLQTIRTPQYVMDSIDWIANKYPDYCTKYVRKANGRPEVRLKDKLKKARK